MSDQAGLDGGASRPPRTAFVLGGGGVLGATQVGMLRGLLEAGIRPDVVLGASVGAVNGAFIAADPTPGCVEQLTAIWTSLSRRGIFTGSMVSQAVNVARHRTHLHSPATLRQLLHCSLPVREFGALPVPFQCVAACVERAAAHWFCSGDVIDAVIASCSVPGLLPPAFVDGEHFYDGGLVDSVPIGRAITLGAEEIYVLHVGRLERELRPPRWPWEVGVIAFELARRHRFVEAMANIPEGRRVHLLPSGVRDTPLVNLRYADARRVERRIDAAYTATRTHLDRVAAATG
jgi:NTE family protein